MRPLLCLASGRPHLSNLRLPVSDQRDVERRFFGFSYMPPLSCEFSNPNYSSSWLAETLAILGRDQERLDHFGLNKVSVKLIELVEPEVVALKVERRFRRVVGIAA